MRGREVALHRRELLAALAVLVGAVAGGFGMAGSAAGTAGSGPDVRADAFRLINAGHQAWRKL